MTYCVLYCFVCDSPAQEDHNGDVQQCRRCGGQLLKLVDKSQTENCPKCDAMLSKWAHGDISECPKCGNCYDNEVL